MKCRTPSVIVLFLILFLALFYSCKKDVAYKVPLPAAPASYLPQTKGSVWQYRDSIYGLAADSFKIIGLKIDTILLTMTSQTTDFNGNICYDVQAFSSSRGSYTEYFHNLQHLVEIRAPSPMGGLLILDLTIDTATVGHIWSNLPTYNGLLFGYPARCLNTLLEKDITRVVKGQPYPNTVHTGVNLQVDKGTGYQNIAFFDLYTAAGIGLIEEDAHVYNNYNESIKLITYNIAQH